MGAETALLDRAPLVETPYQTLDGVSEASAENPVAVERDAAVADVAASIAGIDLTGNPDGTAAFTSKL
jgi:hypothetical protein